MRRLSLLIVLLLSQGLIADDACVDKFLGKYGNQDYDHEFGKSFAKLEKKDGKFFLTSNIPCNTKLTPRVMELSNIRCFNILSADLILIDDGSSQCSVGEENRLFVMNLGEDRTSLSINTDIEMEFPGFKGRYSFQK